MNYKMSNLSKFLGKALVEITIKICLEQHFNILRKEKLHFLQQMQWCKSLFFCSSCMNEWVLAYLKGIRHKKFDFLICLALIFER